MATTSSSRKPRYLTKSRFKLALECPTKLAYTGKPAYANTNDDDPFLRALAEGGFQVGALAQCCFPEGIEVESLDYDESVRLTQELLQRENVTIFEAALRVGNLFVRVDVLKKQGNHVSLCEVKAKSYDPRDGEFFQKRAKQKDFLAKWKPYLFDVAFQTFVARQVLEGCTVVPYLYLVDKTATAAVEGLHQNFLLRRNAAGRPRVEVKRALDPSELQLLARVNVQAEVEFALGTVHQGMPFAQYVQHLADHYASDTRLESTVGGQCKNCEFRCSAQDKASGLKSGFEECWRPVLGEAVEEPLVFDVWNFRGAEKKITEGKLRLEELTREDINPLPRKDGPGLSSSERQWLQIEKVVQASSAPFLDRDGLAAEMNRWRFPLHFIDFETAQPAIPFNRGKRPYEQLAFQFSHHILHEDGRCEHAGEYINMERGKFPNFDFVRALKKELERDAGTIFRFAAHENTILCEIHAQLGASDLPKGEVEELQSWVRTITRKKGEDDKSILWEGTRNMVDLRELVLRYYYQPLTEGSNSLKYVLPASLNGSSYLQERYGAPIYGAAGGITSRNYRNKQWIHRGPDGKVLDPYKTLEPIFSAEEDRLIEAMYPDPDIKDGGAAMMAYARMQYTEMEEAEARRIRQALLRYCELDTFAMVLLVEYWQSEVLPDFNRRTHQASGTNR